MKKRNRIQKLVQWVKAGRGRQQQLAAALGVRTSYLSQMIHGTRPMRIDLCPTIETFTAGEVSRHDCRPLDGASIWPVQQEQSNA